MVTKKNQKYSEEMQEIMGHIPGRIIRWGLTVIFLIVVSVVIGSYYFKYPDIVSVNVKITKTNPPVELLSKTIGKIEQWFINNGDSVEANSPIVILQSIANYEELCELSKFVSTLSSNWKIEVENKQFPEYDELGEVHNYYLNFKSSWMNYKNYLKSEMLIRKEKIIKERIQNEKENLKILEQQLELREQELQLIHNDFKRDSIIFYQDTQVTSLSEYEKSKQLYLNARIFFIGQKTALKKGKANILRLEEELMEIRANTENTLLKFKLELDEYREQLEFNIKRWEIKYLLKSPIKGYITLTDYWSNNQVVKHTGERMATIFPFIESQVLGKAIIPSNGFGKVEVGQKVHVKLSGFSYTKHGMLIGQVKSLSLIPEEEGYCIDIEFDNGMVTNYGEEIKFIEEMDGVADIITEETRLLSKFFDPIKSILKRD